MIGSNPFEKGALHGAGLFLQAKGGILDAG